MASLPPLVLSHGQQYVENFSTSALDFYRLVCEGIARRQIPDVGIERVFWKESGRFSAEREYLRVRRGLIALDICAAPYGTGYFFSWWLAKIPLWFEGILLVVGLLALSYTATMVGVFVLMQLGALQLAAMFALGCFPAVLIGFLTLARMSRIIPEHLVLSMPGIGWLYTVIFKPVTYYNLDTGNMFNAAVQAALREAIETVTKGQGVRVPLSPEDNTDGTPQ